MRAVMMIVGAVALAVTAGAQSNQIQNAQMKTQPVTSLSRDVTALMAQAATTPTKASWVAWQVPMIDGGLFDWVARLTAHQRIVYATPGMGAQLAAYAFRR